MLMKSKAPPAYLQPPAHPKHFSRHFCPRSHDPQRCAGATKASTSRPSQLSRRLPHLGRSLARRRNSSAFDVCTTARLLKPQPVRLAPRMLRHTQGSNSTKCATPAPRDSASMPTLPVPANRSSQRAVEGSSLVAPAWDRIMLKMAARTCRRARHKRAWGSAVVDAGREGALTPERAPRRPPHLFHHGPRLRSLAGHEALVGRRARHHAQLPVKARLVAKLAARAAALLELVARLWPTRTRTHTHTRGVAAWRSSLTQAAGRLRPTTRARRLHEVQPLRENEVGSAPSAAHCRASVQATCPAHSRRTH